MEDTKITIIEGPTPTFEVVYDNWANGIVDSANIASVALTRLRTANGPALVERCYRAWSRKDSIQLEFRATDGLTQEVPIVAARSAETDDGDMLLLWVRLPEKDMVVDFVVDNDEDDYNDYDAFEEDDFDDDEDDDDDYDDYDDYDEDDFDLGE
jgi:hypothetical protein